MVDLSKHNATATILARLVALKIMARLMDPTRDWSWIDRGISFVKARHRPARPKLHRIVDSKELFDFGRREMDRLMVKPARLHDFSKFRDHLIIAMLACVPLRPRNLAELILDRTFVRRDHLWWLQIPAADTKTKNDAIELPLPQELVTYIDHYLAAYREPLVRATGARTAHGAVWLLKSGARMSPAKMSRPIAARIEKALGRRVTPHLFRDCVATSIAERDPAHVGVAVKLLGHRAPETLERHYNQAGHFEANRLVQGCLLSLGKTGH